MGERIDQLRRRLADVHNLNRASAVLGWDQQTYMPPGGAPARAEQLSTLSCLSHDIFIADETGELLEQAAAELNGSTPDSDEVKLIEVARRDFGKARRVPTSLISEM